VYGSEFSLAVLETSKKEEGENVFIELMPMLKERTGVHTVALMREN